MTLKINMLRLITLLLCFDVTMGAQETHPKILLDFDTALQHAYQHAPALFVADIEENIARATTEQVSLLPNPELDIEIDGSGGSGNSCRFDNAEVTYTLSQIIELGGKRGARRKLAESQEFIASWNREIIKLNIRLELAQAFITTFAHQEHIKIASEEKATEEEVFRSVISQVDAGKACISQQHRAEIALARAEHALEHACRKSISSKEQIAKYWYSSNLTFDAVDYPFYDITPPPPYSELSCILENHPDLFKQDLEITAAEENYRLQKTGQIPSVVVSAGVIDYRQTHDTAFTMEFTLPLPLFNRNQGNIAISEYQICLAEKRRAVSEYRLSSELSSAYQHWLCAYNAVCSIRDNILSKARQAALCIREGYQQGKFELLEVLDAQQTLSKIQEEYIEAITEYHTFKVEIERIIGRSLGGV